MIPSNYEEPVSFWEWVRTLLITCVPGIGLVMIIYWACSSRGKTSLRNYARAALFSTAVLVVVFGILAALSVPAFQAIRDQSRAKLAELEAKRSQASGTESPSSATADPADESGREASGAGSVDAAAATGATARPPLNEPLRTFRSADGRTIEARVIAVNDDTVTIQRADGREFTSDMSRFSPEDVEYFMRLRHGGGPFD